MKKQQKAVSLDKTTIEEVHQVAKDRQWSWSQTAAWLIHRGLMAVDRATTEEIESDD